MHARTFCQSYIFRPVHHSLIIIICYLGSWSIQPFEYRTIFQRIPWQQMPGIQVPTYLVIVVRVHHLKAGHIHMLIANHSNTRFVQNLSVRYLGPHCKNSISGPSNSGVISRTIVQRKSEQQLPGIQAIIPFISTASCCVGLLN